MHFALGSGACSTDAIFSTFFRYGKNYLMLSLAMSVRPSVLRL